MQKLLYICLLIIPFNIAASELEVNEISNICESGNCTMVTEIILRYTDPYEDTTEPLKLEFSEDVISYNIELSDYFKKTETDSVFELTYVNDNFILYKDYSVGYVTYTYYDETDFTYGAFTITGPIVKVDTGDEPLVYSEFTVTNDTNDVVNYENGLVYRTITYSYIYNGVEESTYIGAGSTSVISVDIDDNLEFTVDLGDYFEYDENYSSDRNTYYLIINESHELVENSIITFELNLVYDPDIISDDDVEISSIANFSYSEDVVITSDDEVNENGEGEVTDNPQTGIFIPVVSLCSIFILSILVSFTLKNKNKFIKLK